MLSPLLVAWGSIPDDSGKMGCAFLHVHLTLGLGTLGTSHYCSIFIFSMPYLSLVNVVCLTLYIYIYMLGATLNPL